jgi:hypothetical protein
MHPIEFPQQTIVFAKDQPQYSPLPAHVTADGLVTSCWQLTDAEIHWIQHMRRLWITQLTFNWPLQPIMPSAFTPFVSNDGSIDL